MEPIKVVLPFNRTIEDIAIQLYPIRFDEHGTDDNKEKRSAFLVGYYYCLGHIERN